MPDGLSPAGHMTVKDFHCFKRGKSTCIKLLNMKPAAIDFYGLEGIYLSTNRMLSTLLCYVVMVSIVRLIWHAYYNNCRPYCPIDAS
jgi:hypothetical protein